MRHDKIQAKLNGAIVEIDVYTDAKLARETADAIGAPELEVVLNTFEDLCYAVPMGNA